jgi:hypothetical protein
MWVGVTGGATEEHDKLSCCSERGHGGTCCLGAVGTRKLRAANDANREGCGMVEAQCSVCLIVPRPARIAALMLIMQP